MRSRISRSTPSRIVALLGVSVILLSACAARAQETPEAAIRQIERAFERGDADGVLASSGENVEIVLYGASTLFSRSQAEYVLQEFFRENPPEKVAFAMPSRTSASIFATGNYLSRTSSDVLQVFVRLRMKDSQWEVREIRIERRES